MALLPGSPAIAGGATGPGIPTTDQRGQPRTGHVDIGAFQSQGFTLTAVPDTTPQTAAPGTTFKNPLSVTVKANNSAEPVNGGLITFTAASAGGASASLSPTAATIQSGQATVAATANDTAGGYSVTATAAGGASPATFALTNTEALRLGPPAPGDAMQVVDDMASLRAAVAYADSHAGPDTIVFDPAAVAARPLTIVLTGGPLVLTDPAATTIIGPGAGLLTLSGGGTGGVFVVHGGSVAINGLTVSGGIADHGGGLQNDGGTVTLSGCTITGNSASDGGGLANDGGTLSLSDCTVSGNTARDWGGGLANDGGTVSLTGCVVIGNAAPVGGGVFSTGAAALSDVLVRGNRAASGGAIASFGTLALSGVTIRGNTGRIGRGLFDSPPATVIWRRSTTRGADKFGSASNHRTPPHD
jgi:predicted outer membrane repeat protein